MNNIIHNNNVQLLYIRGKQEYLKVWLYVT
jgi:hypothetical protein